MKQNKTFQILYLSPPSWEVKKIVRNQQVRDPVKAIKFEKKFKG